MSTPLIAVRTQVESACQNAGRDTQEVCLIAVSKTWPTDAIQTIIDQGQTVFGENKLQELEQKVPALDSSLEWHYIGGLQRNKVRKTLSYSKWIHSVDNLKLLQAISRIALEDGHTPNIFLQVNIDEEDSKGGFLRQEITEAIQLAHNLSGVNLVGLMCIPRPQPTPEEVRPSFKALRDLRDALSDELQSPLPYLSMGMSSDYPIAIEEGATHIRVGSAIFGARSYQ